MKRILPFLLALTIVTATSPALAGGVLATPLMLSYKATHYGACVVTNVGTSAAEVEVTIKNNIGSTLPPINDTCPTPPATLAAGQSCNRTAFLNEDIYCTFVGKGKFRASVQMIDTTEGVVATFPATAK